MTTLKAHFDGSQIVFDEPPPLALTAGQEVLVIVNTSPNVTQPPRKSLAGFAKGMFVMRDDFNDPLDEFADYR